VHRCAVPPPMRSRRAKDPKGLPRFPCDRVRAADARGPWRLGWRKCPVLDRGVIDEAKPFCAPLDQKGCPPLFWRSSNSQSLRARHPQAPLVGSTTYVPVFRTIREGSIGAAAPVGGPQFFRSQLLADGAQHNRPSSAGSCRRYRLGAHAEKPGSATPIASAALRSPRFCRRCWAPENDLWTTRPLRMPPAWQRCSMCSEMSPCVGLCRIGARPCCLLRLSETTYENALTKCI
jgi:hypothetical protein